jgi:hypothetical protein
MKKSKTSEEIHRHLYELIVPAEILAAFEITGISELKEYIQVELVEKSENFHKITSEECTLNGYLNPLELQHYPVTGKPCLLQLKRRRWKVKSSNEDIFNSYQFQVAGTKATTAFGSFLKSVGW